MSRLALHVRFRARPGRRDTLAERLLTAARQMTDVSGCELYLVSVATAESDTIWVTEIWRSPTDHEASLSAPGAREFIEQTLPLLAGPPERIDLHPLGGAAWGKPLDLR